MYIIFRLKLAFLCGCVLYIVLYLLLNRNYFNLYKSNSVYKYQNYSSRETNKSEQHLRDEIIPHHHKYGLRLFYNRIYKTGSNTLIQLMRQLGNVNRFKHISSEVYVKCWLSHEEQVFIRFLRDLKICESLPISRNKFILHS
jgi:hypothetical protein